MISGGGGRPEGIVDEFRVATSKTRKALQESRKAMLNGQTILLATLLKCQASHAQTLATAISDVEQFSMWSRPNDPSAIRQYMVDEMNTLWTVFKIIYDDIHQLYLPSQDHLQPVSREQWEKSVNRVSKSCLQGANAVRVAWGALSPSETTPDRHETRVQTRDKTIDALNDLAKQLRALEHTLSQISALSRQSDSA